MRAAAHVTHGQFHGLCVRCFLLRTLFLAAVAAVHHSAVCVGLPAMPRRRRLLQGGFVASHKHLTPWEVAVPLRASTNQNREGVEAGSSDHISSGLSMAGALRRLSSSIAPEISQVGDGRTDRFGELCRLSTTLTTTAPASADAAARSAPIAACSHALGACRPVVPIPLGPSVLLRCPLRWAKDGHCESGRKSDRFDVGPFLTGLQMTPAAPTCDSAPLMRHTMCGTLPFEFRRKRLGHCELGPTLRRRLRFSARRIPAPTVNCCFAWLLRHLQLRVPDTSPLLCASLFSCVVRGCRYVGFEYECENGHRFLAPGVHSTTAHSLRHALACARTRMREVHSVIQDHAQPVCRRRSRTASLRSRWPGAVVTCRCCWVHGRCV
jgi:hypothetical protein